MTTPDISALNYHELSELRTRIEQRMTEMRETGVPQLQTRFEEEAAALGLTMEDIVGAAKKRKRNARAHRDQDTG
jgi:TATA-binding protein-associated factor Taf7